MKDKAQTRALGAGLALAVLALYGCGAGSGTSGAREADSQPVAVYSWDGWPQDRNPGMRATTILKAPWFIAWTCDPGMDRYIVIEAWDEQFPSETLSHDVVACADQNHVIAEHHSGEFTFSVTSYGPWSLAIYEGTWNGQPDGVPLPPTPTPTPIPTATPIPTCAVGVHGSVVSITVIGTGAPAFCDEWVNSRPNVYSHLSSVPTGGTVLCEGDFYATGSPISPGIAEHWIVRDSGVPDQLGSTVCTAMESYNQ